MRSVLVAAIIAVSAPIVHAGGFDAIGGNNVTTNGSFWLTSATNTDFGGDATTACGVGFVPLPVGQRLTELQAVIGSRGPGGAGSINFTNVARWHVEFWSSEAAFAAAPTHGDLASLIYDAPSNADYAAPYGLDTAARPTYLVKFQLPGGISPPQTGLTYFAVRINVSRANVGAIGVLESLIGGPSGLWASQTLTTGYLPFLMLPGHTHSGVFAYKIAAGCPGDANGDDQLSVQDIFDFLARWFAGSPAADFNGANGLSVQDIFDFLSAWFGGC